MSTSTEMHRDAHCIAKILRKRGYSYDQSAYFFKQAHHDAMHSSGSH